MDAITLSKEVIVHSQKPSLHFWRRLGKAAGLLKSVTSDPNEMDRLWVVQTFADATVLYLEAYRQMVRGQFMDGWCTLERAEIGFERLVDNIFIKDLVPLILRRAELISLWQTLFPYRYFASPGMRYKKWACSICGRQSTPIEPCGHVPNKVYSGKLCVRIIKECEPIEISIVTDPVQKFSVLRLDYDYSVVQYVIEHLRGPFHEWTGAWGHKRQPHANFADHSPAGPCPCDSGLRYQECCLLAEGVQLPHFQMTVASGSQSDFPEDRIIRRQSNN
jgi:hypothetical protein